MPAAWVHAICDRVEDCAVERNEALARSYGGTEEDVEISRVEARQALASGVVRRWCEVQVGRLKRVALDRIRGCVGEQQACAPFYACARFPLRRVKPPR